MEDIKPYLRLARFRVGERRQLRCEDPMSEAGHLNERSEPPFLTSSLLPPPSLPIARGVPRILETPLWGRDSRLSSHSFPGRSRPRGTRKGPGGWDGGGRSHPREQQPADWPFYRADRSRLYEESHNGNLRSFLALSSSPLPAPSRPLTPRDLFSFASDSSSHSLSSPLAAFHVCVCVCVSS